MKIDQENITNTDTLPIRPPHPSNVPHTDPSPSGCTADNYPELVFHPRMNSRSEANTLYCVRTPLTLHMSCHASVCLCLLCIYCFSPPSYCSVDPATTAADVAVFDYFVDDCTTTVPLPLSFQASSAPSPLPHIAYLSIFICCTRHCCCYVAFLFECIACHCCPLLNLPLSYAAFITILYSAVNPAHC